MRSGDPVVLFERATVRAATVMAGVSADHLSGPTPCTDWDVQHLIDHMVGGTDYLLAALAGETPPERSERSVDDYNLGRAGAHWAARSRRVGADVHVTARFRVAGR